MYFGVWSKGEGRFLTEEFVVRMTAHCMPVDQNKIGSQGLEIRAVFRVCYTLHISLIYVYAAYVLCVLLFVSRMSLVVF